MNTFDNVARTQWFPLWPYAERNTEGLMPGVYEVEYYHNSLALYSYFDGNYWYQASTTPEGALSHRVNNVRTRLIFLAFRGLAENPNDIHVEPWDNDEWVDPKLEHLQTVAACLKYFKGFDEKSQMKYVKEAENIIRELIQYIESTYETVA